MIDGREIVALHGGRNIPVWGRTCLQEKEQARAYLPDRPADLGHYAHLRILSLIDYLNRIQVR